LRPSTLCTIFPPFLVLFLFLPVSGEADGFPCSRGDPIFACEFFYLFGHLALCARTPIFSQAVRISWFLDPFFLPSCHIAPMPLLYFSRPMRLLLITVAINVYGDLGVKLNRIDV